MRDGSVPQNLFKYMKYRPRSQGSPSFFDELLLRITPPHEFNDPFEGILSKDTYAQFIENGSFRTEDERKDVMDRFDSGWEKDGAFSKIEDWGIVSFTEKDNCLIMWAHYADNHKGILIEFNTTSSDTNTHPFFEGEVDTKASPPEMLKIKVNSVDYPLSSSRPSYKPSTIQDMYISIIYSCFSKSFEWEYEEEHRMVLNYDKLADVKRNGMYFKKIPEEVISKIYIGCRAENKNEIIDNFNEAKKTNQKLEHVRVFESVLDENNFKVNYREISL